MNGRRDPQSGNRATAKLGNCVDLAIIMKPIDACRSKVGTLCPREVAAR